MAAPPSSAEVQDELEPELVPQDGHTVEATAVAYSADGSLIATGGFDQSLRVWDTTGALRASLFCDGDNVYEVAFTRATEAVAGGCGGKLWIWSLDNQKLLSSFGNNVIGFALSPDGKLAATVGAIADTKKSALLEIWNARTGALISRTEAPGERQLVAVAWHPQGTWLVTASLDGRVHQWDAARLTSTPISRAQRTLPALAFSPDGTRLAMTDSSGIVVLDLNTHVETLVGKGSDFAWSGDGQLIAIGRRNQVELRNSRTGAVIATTHQRAEIERMALAPDAKAVALVGVDDPVVRVLDPASRRELLALGSGTVERNDVLWSPDGRWLAVAGSTIELWDARSGELRLSLGAFGRRLGNVAMSPDGSLVAAQTTQWSTQVWNTDSGQVVATLNLDNQDDDGAYLAWSAPPSGEATLLVAVGHSLSRWTRTRGLQPVQVDLRGNLVDGMTVSAEAGAVAIMTGSELVLLDAITLKVVARQQLDSWGWSSLPQYDPAARLWATSAGPIIQLWQASGTSLYGAVGDRAMFVGPRFSPIDSRLAFASRQQAIEVWPLGALAGAIAPAHRGTEPAMSVPPPGSRHLPFAGTPRSLAISRDGRLIAAGSDEREVAVWDLGSGRRLWSDRRHSGRLWSLAWDPSGQVLASASHVVRLYRAQDGAALTLRTVPLDSGSRARHAAYVHSDSGHVSGDPEALAKLRFATSRRVAGAKLVSIDSLRERVLRPDLMRTLWDGGKL